MATKSPLCDYGGTIEELRAGDTLVGGGGGGSSPLTTKGDVYVYSTADARLPVGTDGQVLTADSAQTTGLKWSARAYAVGDMIFNPMPMDSTGVPFEKRSFDWLVSEGIGVWGTMHSRTYDAGTYPDLHGSSAATYFRGRVFKLGTNWGALPINSTSSLLQITTDLAAMTNVNFPACAINHTINESWYDESGGAYVAIVMGGKSYAYSTNGSTWGFVPYIYAASSTSAPSTITNACVIGGTYSFYDSTRGKRYHTTDHSTFTQSDAGNVLGSDVGARVHVANGLMFIIPTSGTAYYTSADYGVTWTARTWPATFAGTNTNPVIVHNGTVYLYTTGAATTNTSIWTSADLVTWNNRTCAFTAATTIANIGVANNTFFAFSSASQTKFCTSPDGITWTERTAASASTYGMCFYANSLYFIASTARVESSSALATWALEVASGPRALSRYGADVYMIANGNRAVFTTSGGVWNAYDTGAWSSIATSAQVSNIVSRPRFVDSGTQPNAYVRLKL